MKAGIIEKVEIDPRYVQLIMQNVIKDVFDALVELVTNSDDSYHRQYLRGEITKDGGPITIEMDRRSKDASLVRVKDRAEGMTLDDMRRKIKSIGKRTSVEADRGFMGRGAKECAVLGKAVFESIKDGKYYKCEFNSRLEFIPYEPPQRATDEIRQILGIQRGNGTVVSLQVGMQKKVPKFDAILTELPHHYALRDIFAETSPSKGKLIEGFYSEPLVYRSPEGEMVVDEEFDVLDYDGIRVRLRIWRAPDQLTGYAERFRRSGLVVKGARAIHECSLLYDEFERDPLASKYFGRLECSYIDKLCEEYDKCREVSKALPESNPCLIIDPNRQKGLRRDHPFTQALFKIPSDRLRNLIAVEREKERKKHIQIANEETRGRLNRLAKEASKFIRQQLEEIEEISIDELVDQDAFVKEGMLIYPTYFKLALGEQKRVGIYVRSAVISDEKQITIKSEDKAVTVIDSQVELNPHKTRPGMFLGYFRLRGEAVKDAVLVEAVLNNGKSTSAIVQVVETVIEEHVFSDPLEFEYNTYQIREGRRRNLRLYAKYPEVISAETKAEVLSTENKDVTIRGHCILSPIEGTNYAYGDVAVEGRRLNTRAEIQAKVNGYSTSAMVKVVQKPEEKGIPIKIELRNEDYGNFRARWAEHEGQPNLLLISARHKSLSRYLGLPPDFEGQNAAHFKVLLAEIVTESVCRKSLILEAQERSWEFRWADEREDRIIAESVLSQLHRRMREFAVIAHSIMLESRELLAAR